MLLFRLCLQFEPIMELNSSSQVSCQTICCRSLPVKQVTRQKDSNYGKKNRLKQRQRGKKEQILISGCSYFFKGCLKIDIYLFPLNKEKLFWHIHGLMCKSMKFAGFYIIDYYYCGVIWKEIAFLFFDLKKTTRFFFPFK